MVSCQLYTAVFVDSGGLNDLFIGVSGWAIFEYWVWKQSFARLPKRLQKANAVLV